MCDLQNIILNLYDLPKWNGPDLHDLFILTGIGSVRSARSAHTCQSVCLHALHDLYDLQGLSYSTGVYLSGILVCVIWTSSPDRICTISMNANLSSG